MYGCQQELIKKSENVPFLEYLCMTAHKLMSSQRLASARRGIYWARQWYFKLGYITGKYNARKRVKVQCKLSVFVFSSSTANS